MIDFSIPSELQDLVSRLRAYIVEEVVPAQREIADHDDVGASWPVIEWLRGRARDWGLFAPHLPPAWGGLGLGAVGMALVHQECGATPVASLAINAMAPDEGNMHTLLAAGSDDQLETFLRPLAEGRTRSCFAMTEPDVASSDPTNLETTAVRVGDEWVLNGRKWCITGAEGAAFAIVVAKTATDGAAGHRTFSLILVPCDTPGWVIERHPRWMGSHAAGGHPFVTLTDVRVPAGNLLGDEGEGFLLTQRRLASGRLAHAMRWIGVSQRALDLTVKRLLERQAFGSELAGHQALQFMIADSAMDIHASRMMVLNAAWRVDQGLPHRQEVAMTKTFVSEAFGRVVDRAVQVHGAAGIAMDLPIAQWYQDARGARIYDGASEVHRMTIARELIRAAKSTT